MMQIPASKNNHKNVQRRRMKEKREEGFRQLTDAEFAYQGRLEAERVATLNVAKFV